MVFRNWIYLMLLTCYGLLHHNIMFMNLFWKKKIKTFLFKIYYHIYLKTLMNIFKDKLQIPKKHRDSKGKYPVLHLSFIDWIFPLLSNQSYTPGLLF